MFSSSLKRVIILERIILHIDVNNAFLSWSALLYLKDNYDLRKKYAVVGGDEDKRHGIVLAKSPLAKKLGIKTSETLYSARRKCPNLIVVPPNYKWYSQKSHELFELLYSYTPDIEIASIDECYLDYTKVKNLYGDVLEFAKKIQNQIYNELGFTVNIGIANNKLCAKMASDFTKPNKIHTLFSNEIKEKMWPLPIENLFGIGKSTSSKLRNLNINTIKDLATTNKDLSRYFKNQASKMIMWANGIDDTLVKSIQTKRKGIGNSTTTDHNLCYIEEVYPYLEAISDNIATQLRKEKKYALVVQVVLKDKYFKSYSHQKKLKNATNTTSVIYETSKELLKEMWNDEAIRLVGIRLDNLVENSNYQLSLFEQIKTVENNSKLDETIDEIKNKYGVNIIKRASLMENKITKKY